MQLPTFTQPPADLTPAETVAEWPEGSFLENLAFAADGTLHVTEFEGAKLHTLDAGWERSSVSTPGFHPTGVAIASDQTLVLAGQRAPGFDERPPDAPDGFWRHDPASGSFDLVADAPGARFLNGLTPRGGDRFLAADSKAGTVWQVDLAAGTVEVAAHDDLLAPADPAAPLPAANGIKVRDGRCYVSNWERATIVRAPLTDAGLGPVEPWADDVIVDDFAFADDGALFAATHLTTVVRLDPDGGRATVADASSGVAGCTAPAFAAGEGREPGLYVITDGGTVSGQLEPARLVRLNVGCAGQPLPA